jgi:hypothetical protein
LSANASGPIGPNTGPSWDRKEPGGVDENSAYMVR